MNSDLTRVSTIGMTRPEWLNRRRNTIGGSDAAGIVRLSKWSTPYTVWADKTGRLPDKDDTEAMRIGRDLEGYVASRFTEATGKKVRRVNAMLYNPTYPFAHADIDREIVGENAGLECKTTSALDVRQFGNTEFPEQYYAQCVHYLAVTGADRWYLAVLVFGRGFFTYTLERDEAEISALMDAERAFVENYVKKDVPPPPDGEEVTGEAIRTIYSESIGGTAELFGADSKLGEYMELKSQMKAIELRINEIENEIKAQMQDCESAVCNDYTISWKPQTRRTFDTERFGKDHSEFDLSGYYKTSTCRRFSVSRNQK